jgi:hypothetical protein
MEKITLNKPYQFEGQTYEEIEFDFDNLTGLNLLSAEREIRAMGNTTASIYFSMQYQAAVAAQAAKKPIDFMLGLSAKDFIHAVVLAQNFLFARV